jgi:peptide/nickel transport system substrate-binding protein
MRWSVGVNVAALVAASTLIAAAGCSGSGGSSAGGHGLIAQLPNQDINPRSVDQIADGGTFRTAIEAFPTQWNFYQIDGENGDWHEMDIVLLPHLFRLDANGVPELNRDYLTSAELTSTAPKQVVTYRIDPRAKWSDGTALSWRDFAAVWKTNRGGDPAYHTAGLTGYNLISSVTRGGTDQEVKVTFDKPFGDWKSLFDPLYPATYLSTPDEFNKGWVSGPPATAGAFKISKLDQTRKTVTMVPDPNWWGAKPKLASIVWEDLDQSTVPDAYLNNELDITRARDPQVYRRLKDAPLTAIRKAAQSDESQITFNGTHGALRDVRVRQAIQAAIDRTALAKVASNGLPLRLAPLDNHFYMPGTPHYQDNAAQFEHRDVALAGRLLDQAGWASSGRGKVRTKAGRQLTLAFMVSTDNTVGKQIAQLVQSMLAEIGIKINITPEAPDDYFPKYVDRGAFDIAYFRWQPTPYLSQSVTIYQRPHGDNLGQNFGQIGSPQLDAILDRATQATDPAQAAALYNQADRLIWQEAHSLPLFQTPQVDAVRSNLANFGAQGLSEYDYAKVGFLRTRS